MVSDHSKIISNNYGVLIGDYDYSEEVLVTSRAQLRVTEVFSFSIKVK